MFGVGTDRVSRSKDAVFGVGVRVGTGRVSRPKDAVFGVDTDGFSRPKDAAFGVGVRVGADDFSILLEVVARDGVGKIL